MKSPRQEKMRLQKAEAIRKNDSIRKANKAAIGTKTGRYDLEKNPGESGKNFGKSDNIGKLKPTYGGAKNGKNIKKKK